MANAGPGERAGLSGGGMLPFHVLLIEDNPGDARLIEMMLRGAHPAFEVSACATLAAGIRCLKDRAVDVVLIDLSLPDSRGLPTLARLVKRFPHVPAVVLTGLGDTGLGVQFLQGGAQDFLVKGQFEERRLTRTLRYAMERHKRLNALRSLSLTDELTGLYNRRGFMALAEQHRHWSRRTQRPFLLLFLDVDQLKAINDRFGHAAGDAALCEAARLIRSFFRASDIVARVGGDEFAVLMIDATQEHGDRIAKRLEAFVDSANAGADRPYRLGLSAGCAEYSPQRGPSLEALLKEADEAMYGSKREASGQ
jgi:two-component system cell cycle response regulator